MDKSKINYIIDALMLLLMSAIVGLGLMMKYVLIPCNACTPQLKACGENVELSFLGMERHGWGVIHLYLAFILLGLLTLHIILHWSTIVCLYQKLIPASKWRKYTAIAFAFLCIVLLSFSFFIKPTAESKTNPSNQNRGKQSLKLEKDNSFTKNISESENFLKKDDSKGLQKRKGKSD